MTRINVVPVKELCNKHLFAEWREIPRLRSYLKKSFNSDKDIVIPENYVLGPGHVKFFYDKLQYVYTRYIDLTKELKDRGFNIQYKPLLFLDIEGVPDYWFADWKPNEEDIELNRQRIKQRMPLNPRWKLCT